MRCECWQPDLVVTQRRGRRQLYDVLRSRQHGKLRLDGEHEKRPSAAGRPRTPSRTTTSDTRQQCVFVLLPSMHCTPIGKYMYGWQTIILLLEVCLMDTSTLFFLTYTSGYTLLPKILYLFAVSIFPRSTYSENFILLRTLEY